MKLKRNKMKTSEEMTLDQAESILAAHAMGMFYGNKSEVARATIIVDNAIKKEQDDDNEN